MDLVLLGTGASKGSTNIFPKNPPLGSELYQELEAFYSEFTKIKRKIRIKDTTDFESVMDQIAKSNICNSIVLNGIIAIYFSRFRPEPRNTFESFYKVIESNSSEYIFSPLNYDLAQNIPI